MIGGPPGPEAMTSQYRCLPLKMQCGSKLSHYATYGRICHGGALSFMRGRLSTGSRNASALDHPETAKPVDGWWRLLVALGTTTSSRTSRVSGQGPGSVTGSPVSPMDRGTGFARP